MGMPPLATSSSWKAVVASPPGVGTSRFSATGVPKSGVPSALQ